MNSLYTKDFCQSPEPGWLNGELAERYKLNIKRHTASLNTKFNPLV